MEILLITFIILIGFLLGISDAVKNYHVTKIISCVELVAVLFVTVGLLAFLWL